MNEIQTLLNPTRGKVPFAEAQGRQCGLTSRVQVEFDGNIGRDGGRLGNITELIRFELGCVERVD